ASRSVLAVSDFTRREIVARFPEAEAKTVAIPLGADEDRPPAPSRDEARARLSVTGPLLLVVGAIFNRRCLPDLLRAAASLRRRWPDLDVEVVGEDRTHPPLDVVGLLRGLELAPHVRLSGFVGGDRPANPRRPRRGGARVTSASDTPRLTAIVVSHNTREDLRRCLASLRAHSGIPCRVVVVDNDSSDGSADLVEQEFPEARVIRNRENVGFSRANNQGLREAAGAYALILNSDAELTPGALPAL